MRKLLPLILAVLLMLTINTVSAQNDPAASPIELSPNLCDDPGNLALIRESLGDGTAPRFGEPNMEQVMRMLQEPTQGPFYMVNLIRYRDQADYADGRQTNLTGREANNLYSPVEFLRAIGAQPVFVSDVKGNISGEDSVWDEVAIVEYPCPLAIFAMSAHPEFRERSVHKDAGLEASIVMVTHLESFGTVEVTDMPFPSTEEDPAFELVQIFSFHENAQYDTNLTEPARSGQEAMNLYTASVNEAGAALGIFPKARLNVQGVQIGDGRTWHEIWIYYVPSQAALDALMTETNVVATQFHREAALADSYKLVVNPMLSIIPATLADEETTANPNSDAHTEAEEKRLGFEILEIVSPTEIRAWGLTGAMTREEFDALELPTGWIKNQPRESSVDGSDFFRSPDSEADGERTIAEHFGYTWLHVATVTNPNILVDSEGLLSGACVSKYHDVYFDAGTTVHMLVSPEGHQYVRIGRDAGRTTDEFSLPDGWQLLENIAPEDLSISLPHPTLVIRTENEDSFQGPVDLVGEAGQPPNQTGRCS